MNPYRDERKMWLRCTGIHGGPRHGYVISFEDGKEHYITCACCRLASYNADDIRYRYCGACKIHHDIFISHWAGITELMKVMIKEPRLDD